MRKSLIGLPAGLGVMAIVGALASGLLGQARAGNSGAGAAASAPSKSISIAKGDWPHWAGPNGDCTSDEKGLLKAWPKEGPKVLWRIPVGVGSNHPSVAGDDLCYAQLDDKQLSETICCIDANTGKERWHHTWSVPPIYAVGWGELGPRATPTITDGCVFFVGTFGDAFCFERATGRIVWKHNFREDSPYFDPAGGGLRKRMTLEWKGFNGSLVPVGDKIPYFLWQGGNPPIAAWTETDTTRKMTMLALDAKTGKVAWKFEEECSPGCRGPGLITGGGLPIKFRGEDCLVVHGNRQWKILRLSDGTQVWSKEICGKNEAPAWASGGLRPVGTNLYMDALDGWQPSLVECDFAQEDPKPKTLWTNSTFHEAVTPFVIVDGYAYTFSVDKREEAWAMGAKPGEAGFSLRCTELKTGKLQWKQPGYHYGLSISAAEGMLYVHSYQTLTLVEANPKEFVEKGRIDKLHNLPNRGAGGHKGLLDWNMPAISRGRLFVRTPVEIICYDIRDPGAK
ncbi:MAG: PQQ-binding-like beta-propeller repeat protein [Phycisphaerae bacterium]